MSRANLSIRVFAVYLLALGAALVVAPNAVFAPFGFPPSSEPWPRVLGVVTAALGFYYLQAARENWVAFTRTTIPVRACVFVAFAGLVLAGVAKPALALIGAVDLAGAAWTFLALRGAAERA